MLQSLNHLYGHKLGASDGDFGHVKDFYFEDLRWAVRYIVVATGTWLHGRQVLISPHAVPGLDHAGNRLPVKLSREQIEGSPLIETHKPVSRQFEADFYRYYGLPFYWQGDGMWGISPMPIVEMLPAGLPAPASDPPPEPRDPHLRSTHAVHGSHIQARDGDIGHISDFLMDDRDWVIRQLVVRTGGWLSGTEVQIPTTCVERIAYEESRVHVMLSRDEVARSPAPIPALAAIPD